MATQAIKNFTIETEVKTIQKKEYTTEAATGLRYAVLYGPREAVLATFGSMLWARDFADSVRKQTNCAVRILDIISGQYYN